MSDVDELTQLTLRERQGRDRGWWRQMRECFHEDSTVRLSWFNGSGQDFVTQSEKMSNNGNRPIHRLSPPAIQVKQNKAVMELPAGVEFRVPIKGVLADLISYTRLVMRAERRADAWKLLSIDAVYERDTLIPAVPGTTISLEPDELVGLRPTYCLLGYHLRSLGYEIRNDLYGDDQPEKVKELYDAAFSWAGLPARTG